MLPATKLTVALLAVVPLMLAAVVPVRAFRSPPFEYETMAVVVVPTVVSV